MFWLFVYSSKFLCWNLNDQCDRSWSLWEVFRSWGKRLMNFVVVQSLSCVWLFAAPWTAARQASRYVHSMPTFLRLFFKIINGYWILSKVFFCIYWDDHMDFILQFVDMVYHIDWYVDTEKSFHSWDKSQLIMVNDSFDVFLASVC